MHRLAHRCKCMFFPYFLIPLVSIKAGVVPLGICTFCVVVAWVRSISSSAESLYLDQKTPLLGVCAALFSKRLGLVHLLFHTAFLADEN